MVKSSTVNYIKLDTVASTNTWAKEHAKILDPDKLTCITAETQTAGRGQFNRKWFSPKGLNICASFHFCLPTQTTYLFNLSQLLSISTCQVLEMLGFSIKIKWPNDLIIQNNESSKKLGGILCELVHTKDQIHVIIGIGLNVNLTQEHIEKIDQPATSLLLEKNQKWSCDEILHSIIHHFLKDLHTINLKGFNPFQSYYESHLTTLGKQVLIKDGVSSITGLCQGISPQGKLILLLPSGLQKEVCSGQMELTGI